MQLLNKLNTLKKQLVSFQENKFKNTPFAPIFNESHLISIADDIIIHMQKIMDNGELDDKGIYNFFRKSFKNKCIDEIKKYNCQIRENSLNQSQIENVSFLLEDTSNNHPEKIKETLDNIEFIFKELKKVEKNKPLSRILELILTGYKSEEILTNLNISSSSLDRYKKQIIEILNPLNLQDSLVFEPNYIPNKTIEDYYCDSNNKIILFKIFNFNKENNKTEATLYIRRDSNNIAIKKWTFKHNNLDEINLIIDQYNIIPHLENEERKLYVSK